MFFYFLKAKSKKVGSKKALKMPFHSKQQDEYQGEY